MSRSITGTPLLPIWILLIIGIGFLLLGLIPVHWWQERNDLLENGIKTEGIISDMVVSRSSSKKSSYSPIIKYKTEDGGTYSFKSSFYSSDMHVGDKLDVYYYKNQPEKANLPIPTLFLGVLLIFPLIGTLALLLGIRLFIKHQKKAKNRAHLLQCGQVVTAEITDIYQNTNVKINGRSPYIVECCYTDSHGEKYLYKSEKLYFDPSLYIKDNQIKVYLDSQDKANYYVAAESSSPQVHDLR